MVELLKSFAPAVACATAIFVLFKYLDGRVSRSARQAVARWLKPLTYDKKEIGSALVHIFDRLYTYPLLSWRAFGRCTLISTAITALSLIVVTIPILPYELDYLLSKEHFAILAFGIPFTIICDYTSLFIVRRGLSAARSRPFFALVVGGLLPALLIFCLYTLRAVLEEIWDEYMRGMVLFEPKLFFHYAWVYVAGGFRGDALFYSALIIHLWLPLFAVSVILVRLANWFLSATVWMQWFLARGERHPLEAVGFVAASIVFLGTVLLYWLWVGTASKSA